jgi:phosphatidylserine/phosphatidylglycerophosphate/cardiolipin synthase-like enzyme
LIDDKYVYVGSSNWRVSSLQYNNELNVKSNDVNIVKDAKTYLDAIWMDKPTVNLNEESLFLSDLLSGGYYDSILSKINNANSRIRLIMKFMEYNTANPKASNLLNALVDAKNRGVDVKVIIDDTVTQAAKQFLKDNNIPTKLDPSSSQSTHVKSVLVDNTVYIGSHNWQDINLSVGDVSIIIKTCTFNPVIKEFLNYFDNLWNNGRNI